MCAELGSPEVMDPAPRQNPAMRLVPAGQAVKAMVLNGLGFVTHQLYLVPHFFHNKPLARLIAPAMQARQRNDDTLGRALDTLYDSGVTELSSRIAATAAERLGLAPHVAPLDSPSFPGDGRSNSAEEPQEQVGPLTRGESRDHRPDLTHGMVERMVEHPAGMPVLMQPLSGHSRAGKECGHTVGAHMAPWQTPYGLTDRVAASAR